MTEKAFERVSGLVERVTYHNLENGFCVLRVKVSGRKELLTVVGHAAVVTAGEYVYLMMHNYYMVCYYIAKKLWKQNQNLYRNGKKWEKNSLPIVLKIKHEKLVTRFIRFCYK